MQYRAATRYLHMDDDEADRMTLGMAERAYAVLNEADESWANLIGNKVDKLIPCCEGEDGKSPLQH